MSSDWSLNRFSLEFIERFIIANSLKSVFECGSGASTLVFSRLLSQGVLDFALSLEHSQDFYSATSELLLDSGLNYSQLVYSPLVGCQYKGRVSKWFALPSYLPKLDLVLVDSPPGNTSKMARLPAVYLLMPYLSLGSYVFLDDCNRKDERETLKMWLDLGCFSFCGFVEKMGILRKIS